MSDEIRLVPYDPSWPQRFEEEREAILAVLPKPPLAIEHIGSTAVPGLEAKPIIDILVLVSDLDDARPAIPALEAMGYVYWHDNPDTAKLLLIKGLPPVQHRTHHLHVYTDRMALERHLSFRDRLRADPAARAAYLALKRDLAARFATDREAYTEGKGPFIDSMSGRDP